MRDMLLFAIGSALLMMICAIWYGFSLRNNRKKAVRIMRWIEAALAGQGCIVGVRWLASSRFKVPLRLTCGTFQRAWIVVELAPRESPITWLSSQMKKRQDLLVFEADLDLPPAFSLDVHNLHWLARSTRKKSGNGIRWTFEQATPLVISTRIEWQKEITSTMSSLTTGNYREFLNIRYQRKSPNFSVTLPMDAFAPGSRTRTYIFENMRELAANASASLS